VTTAEIVAASVTANPISIEFPETTARSVSYVMLLLAAPVVVVKALSPCPANTALPSLIELPDNCTSGTNSSDASAHTDIVICFTDETFEGITKLDDTLDAPKLSIAWNDVVALSWLSLLLITMLMFFLHQALKKSFVPPNFSVGNRFLTTPPAAAKAIDVVNTFLPSSEVAKLIALCDT